MIQWRLQTRSNVGIYVCVLAFLSPPSIIYSCKDSHTISRKISIYHSFRRLKLMQRRDTILRYLHTMMYSFCQKYFGFPKNIPFRLLLSREGQIVSLRLILLMGLSYAIDMLDIANLMGRTIKNIFEYIAEK